MERIQEWARNNKLTAIGLATAGIVIAALGWYFLYWVRTPSYSLGLIRDAVKQHDLAAFQKHVDTEKFIGSLYDDGMAYKMDADGMNNPLVQAMVQAFKPTAVSLLKTEIEESVQGIKKNSESADENEQRTKNLSKQTGLQDAFFDKIDKTVVEGNAATVTLVLRDKKLEKDFKVDIAMTKLEDGSWQAIRFANFKNYLVEHDKVKKEKLEELNQPIREKIKNLISIKDTHPPVSVSSKTNFGWTEKASKVRMEIFIASPSDVSKFTYLLQVTDGTGNILMTDSQEVTETMNNQKNYSLDLIHKLNPFIEKDKEIDSLVASGKEIKSNLEILSVTNAEGTTALLTEIPEKDLPARKEDSLK